MNHQIIITKTKEFVKKKLVHAEGGHDWWHALRVWKNALQIASGFDDCNYIKLTLISIKPFPY